MPFFRPLSQIGPDYDRNLPWPLSGQAYIAASMGPIAAGFFGGMLTAPWGIVVGFLLGICVSLANACLSDRFLDPLIAKHQSQLLRMIPRVLVNITAFAWALFLSGVSMAIPILLFDRQMLLASR